MLRPVRPGKALDVTDGAHDLVPARPTLPRLRKAPADCRACPLWENATQTVFGAGSRSSVAMFVGEQPGDREDREGAPFVGPAGRILDEALDLAGIDRRAAYVTDRGQALQVGAAGQAPHTREAELGRAHRLPPVARSGARRRASAGARLPGRDGGAGSTGPPVSGHTPTRRVGRIRSRRPRDRDDPPERHPASRRPPRHRDGGVRAGSEAGRICALAEGARRRRPPRRATDQYGAFARPRLVNAEFRHIRSASRGASRPSRSRERRRCPSMRTPRRRARRPPESRR